MNANDENVKRERRQIRKKIRQEKKRRRLETLAALNTQDSLTTSLKKASKTDEFSSISQPNSNHGQYMKGGSRSAILAPNHSHENRDEVERAPHKKNIRRELTGKNKEQYENISSKDVFITPSKEASILPCKLKKERNTNEGFQPKKQSTKPLQTDNFYEWPTSSSKSLPSLPQYTLENIMSKKMDFMVNEECTSLSIPPSGRQVVAGFTDGTLRLFDTTGRLWCRHNAQMMEDASLSSGISDESDTETEVKKKSKSIPAKQVTKVEIDKRREEEMRLLFDCDSSSDSEAEEEKANGKAQKRANEKAGNKKSPRITPSNKSLKSLKKKDKVVLSKSFQTYGAVGCQIHARGVITSLLMDVGCSEDGLFAFGGVLRGSTELVAIDLSAVERFHDSFDSKRQAQRKEVDILDLIQVYRHSDAKLKGFGACTRLNNRSGNVEYRLFTGKGIKNIHIWSFIPPMRKGKTKAEWQCLYDTPTNGNTITHLHFRHDANGLLQGISKSDDQKLRIWDLSFEQHQGKIDGNTKSSIIKQLAKKSTAGQSDKRPKRPPYVDVTSTENALGVFGPYAFSAGAGMYNQMSVLCLDVEDIQSPFNHTELALPDVSKSDNKESWNGRGNRPSRSGRQQRGELKSVVSVSGLSMDGGHVILELSDGTFYHYSQNDAKESRVKLLPLSLYSRLIPEELQNSQINCGALQQYHSNTGTRKMHIARIGSNGIAVLASSSYDTKCGRGSISLRHLSESDSPTRTTDKNYRQDEVTKGFWGFHGITSSLKSFNSDSKTMHRTKNNSTSHSSPHFLDSCSPGTYTPIKRDVSGLKSPPKTSKLLREDLFKTSENSDNLFVTPDPQKSEGCETIRPCEEKKNKTDKVIIDSDVISPPGYPIQRDLQPSPPANLLRSFDHTITFDSPSTAKKIVQPRAAVSPDQRESSPESQTEKSKESINHNQRSGSIMQYLCLPSTKDKKCGKSSVLLSNSLDSEKENNLTTSVPESGGKENGSTHNSSITDNTETRKPTIFSSVLDQESALNLNISGQESMYEEKKRPKFSDVKGTIIEDAVTSSVEGGLGKIGFKIDVPFDVHNEKDSPKLTKTRSIIKKGKNPYHPTKPRNMAKEVEKESEEMIHLKTEDRSNLNVKPGEGLSKCKFISSSKSLQTCEKKSIIQKEEIPSNPTIPRNFAKEIVKEKQVPDGKIPEEMIHLRPKERLKMKAVPKGCKIYPSSKNLQSSEKKPLAPLKATRGSVHNSSEFDVASALCEFQRGIEITINKRGRSTRSQSPTRDKLKSSIQVTSPKNELEKFLYSCHKRKRPRLLGKGQSSVASRMGISVNDHHASVKLNFNSKSVFIKKLQETERRNLALHHRASHERLKRVVLDSAERVMNIVTVADVKTQPKNQIIDGARAWLNEALMNHEEIMRDMLDRQRMEASALSAKQTMENGGVKAPELQVSFPFPEVFSLARERALHYLRADS